MTSRKLTSIHLNEANAYLAAIVESSDDAIISKDLNGIITSWNQAAEKIFGYAAEEAIGQHITLIIPTERHSEEHVIISKIKSGEKVDHFETIRRAKDGSLVELSITVSPIKSSGGQIIGASKVARDITKERQTEKALIEASHKKEEFIASVSHELRTPMNAIMGLGSILSRSANLDEKEKLYVKTLNQSAENMMALINDLLDFSKLESGNIQQEEIEFRLPETLEKILTPLRLTAKEKKIELKLIYKTSLREYYLGEPIRFQQILTNLIANAIKFTDEGGVTVEIRGTEKEGITELTIDVIDTGIGIAEDKTQAIFDKFVQADSSITRKYGGSGLGLAITKAFTERMGGTVTVKSKLGLGSTFTLKLPLKHSEQDGIVQPESISPPSQKKNVLLVEDYEPNIIVATAMLDHFNYTYDIAVNGSQALRQFRQHHYDLILMDIQMEGMDGLESTKRIRQYELENNLRQTPIIAMTAHVQEKDKNKCLEIGMNDFIPKPFSHDILEEKLAKFIKE